MKISINKTDLKEIDYIINHFVENNKNETISVSALAFCLHTLIDGEEKLKKVLEEED
jgi:hypothetical protein